MAPLTTQHVRAYLQTVRPPFLSYDHYSLMEWGDRPGYFANLETIRAEALQAGVPFWNIILATPHFDYRDPSPADLRWQVNTTLAYGGKGLAYFTYWTPDVENFRDGIIGLDGRPTLKYDVVARLNRELRGVGRHMLGLTSSAVHHWPDAPAGATVQPLDGLVAGVEGGEYVIGEFRDAAGLPWLYLANRDRARSARVTLRLRTSHAEVSEVARSTGELRAVTLDQGAEAVRRYADGLVVHFWLGPAEGKLMRLADAAQGTRHCARSPAESAFLKCGRSAAERASASEDADSQGSNQLCSIVNQTSGAWHDQRHQCSTHAVQQPSLPLKREDGEHRNACSARGPARRQ